MDKQVFHVVAISLLLLGCFAIGGCLVTMGKTETKTGNYVSQSTIDQIGNDTTKDWVAAMLGQPTSKVTVDAQGEVWKYTYSEKQEKDGAILFIFGSGETTVTEHTLFIEFHGERVFRHWVG